MPKAICYNSVKINGYIKEFGSNILTTDGKILICVYCGIKVNHDKKHHIQQHLQTEKHKTAVSLKLSTKVQPVTSFLNTPDSNEFFRDITKMMVACDIPLFKANHTEFKSFMAKYAQKKVPDQSTMRKHYLKEVYENVLKEIRSNIGDSSIFVSIDESTDKAGRYVCNVVVGPLRQGGRGYLLTSEVIPKVNASEIAKLFDNSLKLLWPEEVQRDKVLIFVTDAAPYMKKSVVGIQLFYPRIIHITCIAHGVHRICEKLRSQYANVDSLIANIKKAFSKSPSRIRFFKEKQPDLPLPPQPVSCKYLKYMHIV